MRRVWFIDGLQHQDFCHEMLKAFSLSEIKQLCVDLDLTDRTPNDIDVKLINKTSTKQRIYEALCRITKECESKDKVKDLIEYCVKVKPRTDWLFIFNYWLPEDIQINLKASRETKGELYELLSEKFSLTDLEELCFLLDIDWESLRGDDKKVKIRTLINYFVQRDEMELLVLNVKKLRPKADL